MKSKPFLKLQNQNGKPGMNMFISKALVLAIMQQMLLINCLFLLAKVVQENQHY